MFLVCLSRQCSVAYPMNQTTVVLLLTIIVSNSCLDVACKALLLPSLLYQACVVRLCYY